MIIIIQLLLFIIASYIWIDLQISLKYSIYEDINGIDYFNAEYIFLMLLNAIYFSIILEIIILLIGLLFKINKRLYYPIYLLQIILIFICLFCVIKSPYSFYIIDISILLAISFIELFLLHFTRKS